MINSKSVSKVLVIPTLFRPFVAHLEFLRTYSTKVPPNIMSCDNLQRKKTYINVKNNFNVNGFYIKVFLSIGSLIYDKFDLFLCFTKFIWHKSFFERSHLYCTCSR